MTIDQFKKFLNIELKSYVKDYISCEVNGNNLIVEFYHLSNLSYVYVNENINDVIAKGTTPTELADKIYNIYKGVILYRHFNK